MTKFLFHVDQTPDPMLQDMGFNPYGIAIVEADFWTNNRCLNDDHISDDIAAAMGASALDNLDEVMESMFTYVGPEHDRDTVVSTLQSRGFVEDTGFSGFMDRDR